MEENHSLAFEHFCSLDALYDASYKVCRNVRWKDSTIQFEASRLELIQEMAAQLRAGEYRQLVFSCFSIIERGKPRDIRACHITDRMVQNALCEAVLLPVLTPRFIVDNCATLRERGIDYALDRFKKHFQAANREYKGEPFYCLRIDVRKYFDSIQHDALKALVDEVIHEPDIQEICHYLISTFAYKITHDKNPVKGKQYFMVRGGEYVRFKGQTFEPHKKYYEYETKSLGLGSQTSQLFALLTLNKVDHFVKEKLHIKYYGRYMDDMYLIHQDKKYLNECKKQIGVELAKIGLFFNPDKTVVTKIKPHDKGEKPKVPIKYLKWNFFITKTGHITMSPFKKKLGQQRRKLRKMQKFYKDGKLSQHDLQISYQGWRANMDKGTTFYAKQNMDNHFRTLFKGVEII